jgi:uncharacterized membrane protein YfcA
VPPDIVLLLIAGFFGGFVNSVAGGGSFITFPALLLVGVPPISANATNTFASCFGYLSGAYAFRHDLGKHRHELPGFIILSLLGGILGAWLLLKTPESLFREAIPWLLLFATLLFIFGGRLNAALKEVGALHRHVSSAGRLMLWLTLLAISVYGGFFNAGLGIVILSYLALAGHDDIHAMNGLKLLVSSTVSLIAIALFAYDGVIAWHEGGIVLLGTLVGGYAAARLSRRLPQRYVRASVIVAGFAVSGYFFYTH